MSDRDLISRRMVPTINAVALVCLLAGIVAGCSGGGSNGITPVLTNTPPPPTQTSTKILRADAGPVCETLLAGEAYTRTPPALSCNGGADPYTAYLDGSGSTSSDSGALSYAWSFVSRPAASAAQLVGADTVNPTFVPDVGGPYEVQLVVSNNGVSSPRAIALVVALDDATLSPNVVANPGAPLYAFHGGLASDCVQCHTGAVNPTLLGKPGTHVASSDVCQSCHWPAGFNVVNFVDHDEVFGTCSGCHDGITAIGKSDTHVVTTQECSDCHTTFSFVNRNPDGSFDHTNITGGCSNCHNGIVAIGTESDPNPAGHPSISAECNACHTTATFASPFPNHADPSVVVPGTCGQSGCHDGATVLANGTLIPGKNSAPFPHAPTGTITVACDVCHNVNTFDLANAFDHGILARNPTIACKGCHDGQNAVGMIPNHIPTAPTSDCSNCHNTTTFIGGFVDHTSAEVLGQACTACHDNAHDWSFIDSTGATVMLPIPGVPSSTQALIDIHDAAALAGQTCDDCHTAGGSFSLVVIDHSGFGTVGNITLPAQYPSCEGCHDDVMATGKPSNHIDTTQDCGACHDPQLGNWLGAGYDHSALSIVGNVSTPSCGSCHDGSGATGQSSTHVPEPRPGQDCLECHGTTFVSFALPTFDHFAAGIAGNCASCHDGRAHDGIIGVAKPSGHIPTSNDCSFCHVDTLNGPGINGTSSSGFSRADRFVGTVHPAYTTGCGACHNGSYDNATYNARGYPNTAVHATVIANGWDCNACHSVTGNFGETSPVNHQDPAVKAQQCVSCHVAGQTTSPMGKNGAHPATSDRCQDCHQAGGSFVGGFDHATLNPGGANQNLACSSCHNGQVATGKDVNHLPTSRDCKSCHAGYPPAVSSFAGGTFDHTGPEMVSKQCMSCHNGTIALGKSNGHPLTNADCGACHSTSTFSNPTGFDHSGVTTGCAASGCHAAGTVGIVDVTDDPNPLPHIPISNGGSEVNCYACHKSAGGTFANATMDHSVVTFEACENCHDGAHDGANPQHVVTPKSPNHFVTSIDACASCHKSNTAWTVGATAYTHPNGSGYPGNHSTRRITRCAQCHNNNPPNENISTFPSATYGSTCATCHASQGTREHGNPLPSRYYNCGNSGCHRVSDSSF